MAKEEKKMHRLYGLGNSELRRKAKIEAAILDMNLVDFVTASIEEKIARERRERNIRSGETETQFVGIDNDPVERAR